MAKVDHAILALLSLDADSTTLRGGGGGGCSSASTSKIETTLPDGTKRSFFLKTGHGPAAEIMFRGEHASLNAIHGAVPSLCPKSYGHGRLESSPSTFFLATDFMDLTRGHAFSSNGGDSSKSLAAKLARLHQTPAPIPQGHSKLVFGFPETTCCGDTPQPNGWCASWADFYKTRRLQFILERGEANQGRDAELRRLVEQICERVVPRLIGDGHLNGGKGITPVVCHGDLWSGNASRGVIGGGSGEPEDIVYDPSCVYGHAEYDLGIMNMFGGFSSFFGEYHRLCPKTEPADEYADRVRLYELYHHLNHHAMFGGGYRGGAVRIMQDLLRKYG